MEWKNGSRVASYWHFDHSKNKVECDLCPRHCQLKPGQDGFCRVRGNVQNELHTFNFGRSIQATEECIETEAINHFRPGARILSMGNVGCMMACSFCQNWQTSQVKHLDPKHVEIYTPEEVVAMALANNIGIISWTYNDPVVWQEFVVETSRLAQKNGIKTLYKSALYIETEPLRELIEVIDIFSISLKSMKPEVYKKVTKGELQPVLNGIKQIAASGRHLEISQLVVTDLNDDGTDARETARWIVENIGAATPLHFVAYHPAYRYTKERTPLEKLVEARNIALEEGIVYSYLGNVYSDDVSNTVCRHCHQQQVERFGLTVQVTGLDEAGNCTGCGMPSDVKEPLAGISVPVKEQGNFEEKQKHTYTWSSKVNSLHIVAGDTYEGKLRLEVKRMPSGLTELLEMNEGLERIILSKSGLEDQHIEIRIDNALKVHLLPVLDRAHFPVAEDLTQAKKYLN